MYDVQNKYAKLKIKRDINKNFLDTKPHVKATCGYNRWKYEYFVL